MWQSDAFEGIESPVSIFQRLLKEGSSSTGMKSLRASNFLVIFFSFLLFFIVWISRLFFSMNDLMKSNG